MLSLFTEPILSVNKKKNFEAKLFLKTKESPTHTHTECKKNIRDFEL